MFFGGAEPHWTANPRKRGGVRMSRARPVGKLLEIPMTGRETRRFIGALCVLLPEVRFERVPDPRRKASVKHPLPGILAASVVGLMTGKKGLGGVETLTEDVSPATRRALGIRRRLPDTTVRDVLVQVDPLEARQCLLRATRAAHRRKAIHQDGLPFGALSMDGKATAIEAWDDTYAQKQPHSSGRRAHGLLRTVSSCLVSSEARPCIDAFPIPAHTNEMGVYTTALDHVLEAYGPLDLFRVILYDAGACSEHNARYTRSKGLEYVFCLNEAQPTLFAEARQLLGSRSLEEADHMTEDRRGGGVWRRYVFLSEEMTGWLDWDHLRTVVRIASVRISPCGEVESVEDRYYLSSLRQCRLRPSQWNLLIRRRWAVENEVHHTLDTIFSEDEHPWLVADPRGALVVMMLRRLAYTLMALFRSVTLRSEENRLMPWARLVEKFFLALVKATQEHIAGLRRRRPPPFDLLD